MKLEELDVRKVTDVLMACQKYMRHRKVWAAL